MADRPSILTTRIQALARSYEAPHGQERVELFRLIKESKARAKRLAYEIRTSPRFLEHLICDHEQITEEIKIIRSLPHPIRSLPSEILSHIFLLCANENVWPVDFGEENWTSLDTRHPPWTLAQVCRRWRAIGTACSELWTRIAVDLIWPDDTDALHVAEHRDRAAYLLRVQLKRSQTRKLSVAIFSGHPFDEEMQILEPIISCSSRWENASFLMPWRAYADLAPVRGCPPSLRRLHIEPDGLEEYPYADDYDAFEIAPCLNTLSITDLSDNAPYTPDILRLPWTGIENYKAFAVYHSSNIELQVLDRMKNLATCEISGQKIDVHPLSATVHCLCLHSLDIQAWFEATTA